MKRIKLTRALRADFIAHRFAAAHLHPELFEMR